VSVAPTQTRQLVVIPVLPELARSAPALLVASSFPQPCSGQWVLLLLSSGHVVLPLLCWGSLFSFYVLLKASSLATALLGWLLSSRPSWDDSVSPVAALQRLILPLPHTACLDLLLPCSSGSLCPLPKSRAPAFAPALLEAFSFVPVLLRASLCAHGPPWGILCFKRKIFSLFHQIMLMAVKNGKNWRKTNHAGLRVFQGSRVG